MIGYLDNKQMAQRYVYCAIMLGWIDWSQQSSSVDRFTRQFDNLDSEGDAMGVRFVHKGIIPRLSQLSPFTQREIRNRPCLRPDGPVKDAVHYRLSSPMSNYGQDDHRSKNPFGNVEPSDVGKCYGVISGVDQKSLNISPTGSLVWATKKDKDDYDERRQQNSWLQNRVRAEEAIKHFESHRVLPMGIDLWGHVQTESLMLGQKLERCGTALVGSEPIKTIDLVQYPVGLVAGSPSKVIIRLENDTEAGAYPARLVLVGAKS